MHDFHVIRQHEVAVAHVANNLSASLLQGRVPIWLSSPPMLRMIKKTDTRVLRCKVIYVLASDLLNSVSNYEDLNVTQGLALNGANLKWQQWSTINACGDYNCSLDAHAISPSANATKPFGCRFFVSGTALSLAAIKKTCAFVRRCLGHVTMRSVYRAASSREAGLRPRITLRTRDQHADQAHALTWLRTRRKRPRHGRAAEKRD
jgi:hypothetical protein